MEGKANAFSLYLHIPYCLAKCPYCDFNSYAVRSWPEERYVDALIAELRARAAEAPWRCGAAATIFFGGGTPSLLRPTSVARLLDAVAAAVGTAPQAEITLEANPGTVERTKLAGFRGAGVNRISFGVQTFQPSLLQRLGRRHSADDSRNAIRAAQAAGFTNVSLDLIYAIPGQSLEQCASDLDAGLALGTEHLSAYSLTYEEGTPFRRERDLGRLRPAPEELEVAMHELVRARLAAAGFRQYEISNFARPGFACRHNRAYWTAVPYLGLGAGANSYDPGGGDHHHGRRWENERDPNRYIETAIAHGRAESWHESLTRDQAIGEHCWLALRRCEGVDTEVFRERFGVTFEQCFPHVSGLARDGLVQRTATGIQLTRRGELYADTVFASFFAAG